MLATLNDVLPAARRGGYGVGLFNTVDTDMLQAVIDAAEEAKSPVIIGTAEILLPYGEIDLIFPSIVAAAERASVPVVVHYDHGLTFGRCIQALKAGCTSVMYDGSAGDHAKNLAETREIVRIAHAYGASVEGEIGHVGQAKSGDNASSAAFTTPEEAAEFVSATGVDALAVAFGTAHGVYKIKPCLDLARLRAIRAAVLVPLVMHGGSGLSDDDFRNAIRDGIAKVNIFTDLCLAGAEGVRKALAEGKDYLDSRNAKVDAIRRAVLEKIALFGSAGRG